VVSDADSETVQIKEEFEKKEKDYRVRIHTLKKEVNQARESLSKTEQDYHGNRDKVSNTMNIYAFLDNETQRKVHLKDVKISLIKERIDRAKL